MLSRAKPAVPPSNPTPSTDVAEAKKMVPKLETFIAARDYVGAVTLLEFLKASGKGDAENMLWLGYSFFHLGDYRRAMETYQTMLLDPNCDPLVHLHLACCYFFLGMYKESDDEAQRGPTCKLQNRLLFHLSHKFNDEKRLMGYHQNLQDVIEDQLSLASIHYLRSHYQEAIDIYKRILLENRDFLAINVYVAMCYYKLDYYDVSQEVLSVYLQHYPDSVIATNLKACNHFRLYNGKAAESELKSLSEKMSHNFRFAEDLIRHNLVVFRNGEGALQVFPPLLDVIPEARLNLVIYHLRNDDIVSAFNLMKDVEPSTPQEYILKGIVNASLGQEQESREHLKIAQQYFQLVGGSASECDTIPGRQCMASCFFLLKQFEDVLIYLNSIKGYFYNDDTFNYNYAQAKVATGAYEEGEELLLMIQNEKYKNEYAYLSHLARCYIMNKKPRLAWELYLKMETSSESFSLLQLIANDCYKMGQYYYSAKAFDVLERLDPNPEFWEGKRGSCVGVFKQIIAGDESKDSFRDIITMLRNTSNPQIEYIIRIMKKVLCVAEKPSISKSVSEILSDRQFQTHPTQNKYVKNYEFEHRINGSPCTVVMTALLGHLKELEFGPEWKAWRMGSLQQLFQARLINRVKPDMEDLASNLRTQARRSQMLVIWTDCDREGENIGSEVADVCREVNPNIIVKRARFSVVQPREIKQAWNNLGELDLRAAAAVDARTELDLRIGAVFTRFQTLRLQKRFHELEDKKVLSYGPCQFPTLWFVIDRYLKAKNFVPEPFWKIDVVVEKDGIKASFNWSRGHLFDQHLVLVLYEMCVDDPVGTIVNVNAKPKSKWAPLPLTTVELQKTASRSLKMSSDRVMHIAEALYNQGIISYPRTETDCFDDNFQLMPLIEKQTQDPNWGTYARELLNGKFCKPRKGKNNDQAHPPIHPVRADFTLTGEAKAVYDFVTRRFLACCSAAAKGQETIVDLDIAGERFTAKGLMILERNYLDVYPFEKWSDCNIPTFAIGERVRPSVLEMHAGQTTRPALLTEADLITLMDNSGIGTDATIHEHIKKILEREYARKENGFFFPTTLGMALVTAYEEMDIEMSLSRPLLRSKTEASMKHICDGVRARDDVVAESIAAYRNAFAVAFQQAEKLDQACARLFGHEPDIQPPAEREQGLFIRNCPKCRAPMTMKTLANGCTMIGCEGYPACRESVFLPEFVTAVVLSENL
eukprot:jgi/Hompol1/775/HPOL_002573-RA